MEVLTAEELVAIDISCPILAEQPSVSPAAVGPAGSTVGGLGLDRDAGYFLAAIALCEPRLRDPSTSEVASVAQVARTLSRVGPERVSVKAAERRLAHLRSRLGVGGDALGGSAAGLEVRDAGRQLVDLLLRTGTVTVADLARLEPRDHDTSDGSS